MRIKKNWILNTRSSFDEFYSYLMTFPNKICHLVANNMDLFTTTQHWNAAHQ